MPELTLEDAISKRRSHRAFDDRPLSLSIVRKILWAGQGITDASGKRTVASAHALHPLRLFVISGHVTDLPSGVHCVGPDAHDLTPHLARDIRTALECAAIDDQPWIARASAIITICADMVAVSKAFVDQPPYGARGRRYAYLEAGAASQNMHLAATAEGLACVPVAGFRDETTADVLQLPAAYEPLMHLCIGWPHAD